MKKIKLVFTVSACVLISALGLAQTPVSINGKLSVVGLQLTNEHGNPVQLRGMSTHGLQWYPWGDCLNDASLDVLAYDWGSDILRISMYIQEGGYETDKVGFTNQVKTLVNEATDRGMYALIDFHQLNPGDPRANTANAIAFFTDVANEFKDYNNVIYDICNEPNGVNWAGIREYALDVIPVIRAIDGDAVVLCGTHGWSTFGVSGDGNLQDVINNPLPYTNIMYTFHFYAATHGDIYLNRLDDASDVLPVFVTEWGTQNAAGESTNNFTMSQRYIDLMREKKISWCNWNFSDDTRSGAVWKVGTCSGGPWTVNNLKEAGVWVRDKILFPADNFIGAVATCSTPNLGDDISICGLNSLVLDGQLSPINGRIFTWTRNGAEMSVGATQNILSITEPGTYVLKVDSASCSKSDEIEVFGNLPSFTLSDINLCSPANVTATIPITGSNISYNWKQNNVDVGSEQSLSIDEAGIYKATISASNCSDVSDEITVTTSLPEVDDAIICAGNSAILEVNGSGSNFEWYDASNQLVKSGASYTTPVLSESTTYSVIAAGGSGSALVGESTKGNGGWYNNQSEFAYKVKFSANDAFSLNYLTLYSSVAQTFDIIITKSDGSPIGSKSVTVSVGTNRVAINIDIPQGANHLIYPDGATGLWLDDGTSSIAPYNYPYTDANSSLSIVSILPYWDASDNYTDWFAYFYNWEISTAASCDPVFVEVTVDLCTSVNDKNESIDINVYPNPTSDLLYISSNSVLEGTTAELYNDLGKKIFSMDLKRTNMAIPISYLNNGAYLLKLSSDEGVKTFKVVKN